MRLIQWHLDRYGVTRATFAKRIGTTPQTVQNWKTRSTTMPRAEHLVGVAKETGVPYLIVLDAALVDAGYRESLVDDGKALRTRIARYVRVNHDAVAELENYLATPFLPDEDELPPGTSTAEIDALIDSYISAADQARYGNDELFDRDLLHQYISDKAPAGSGD